MAVIFADAGKHDLVVRPGRTLLFTVELLDEAGAVISLSDLTSATAQVRADPGGELVLTPTCTVGATSITIEATHTDTANYKTPRAVWELLLTWASGRKTIGLEGVVTMKPAIVQ